MSEWAAGAICMAMGGVKGVDSDGWYSTDDGNDEGSAAAATSIAAVVVLVLAAAAAAATIARCMRA